MAAARAAFAGLVREMPSTRILSSAWPAAGTSSTSARSPPTNRTSAPSARSASATAIAGTTCPAVPPAAITTFGGSAALGGVTFPAPLARQRRRCAEPPLATLSSSPIEHSSTISDVDPDEMNGSGTPVSGASPRTA